MISKLLNVLLGFTEFIGGFKERMREGGVFIFRGWFNGECRFIIVMVRQVYFLLELMDIGLN